jgi:hypothetical protein
VRPLAPSPAWTLVTPYCKRTRPGRGTNTKAAGFPPLSRPPSAAFPSPLRARPRAEPSRLGHAATFHSSAQGPPGLETLTPAQSTFLIWILKVEPSWANAARDGPLRIWLRSAEGGEILDALGGLLTAQSLQGGERVLCTYRIQKRIGLEADPRVRRAEGRPEASAKGNASPAHGGREGPPSPEAGDRG